MDNFCCRTAGFFLGKKTLRNTQYKNCLDNDLRINTKSSLHNCSLSLILRSHNFTLGWYQTQLLISSGFVMINSSSVIYSNKYLQHFDVVSFMKVKGISKFLKNHRRKASRALKKIKKRGYIWRKVSQKR